MFKLNQIKPFIIQAVICRFFFHDWEITKWCIFKDKKSKYLEEEGYDRTCLNCSKKQTLKRPKKYHPSKYVWSDLNDI
jgi:hypothetical protein